MEECLLGFSFQRSGFNLASSKGRENIYNSFEGNHCTKTKQLVILLQRYSSSHTVGKVIRQLKCHQQRALDETN